MWLIRYLTHNHPTNSSQGLPILPYRKPVPKNSPEAHLQSHLKFLILHLPRGFLLRNPDFPLGFLARNLDFPRLSYTDLFRSLHFPPDSRLLP
jgi:hypothetical protein